MASVITRDDQNIVVSDGSGSSFHWSTGYGFDGGAGAEACAEPFGSSGVFFIDQVPQVSGPRDIIIVSTGGSASAPDTTGVGLLQSSPGDDPFIDVGLVPAPPPA